MNDISKNKSVSKGGKMNIIFSFVLFSFFFVNLLQGANISGKIANWDPDTGGNFLVIASTDPDNPGGSMKSSTTVNILPNSVSTYTLSGLLDGTYFIFALLDLNGNNEPDPDEPNGDYEAFKSTTGPEPVVISGGADVLGIDFVCMSKVGPYLLKGIVESSDSIPVEGVFVGYEKYSVPNDTTSVLEFSTSTYTTAVISSGDPNYIPDYNFEIVLDTTTNPSCVGYFGEYQRVISSSGTAFSEMWIYFDTHTPSGLFYKLTLSSSAQEGGGGKITGIIDYTGSQTGDLYIIVGHGDPNNWESNPSLVEDTQNLGIVSFSYTYTTGILPAATDYTVVAWIDSTADGTFDSATEPGASYSPVIVNDGETTTGIDLTLQDPGAGGGEGAGTESVFLDNVSVSPTTISPNGDGIDDEFELSFVVKSTVSATDVNVRIILDINGNGIADLFDWNKVIWDNYSDVTGDDSAPYLPHYLDVELSTSSPYYPNDYYGYYFSLSYEERKNTEISYEELNALQAGYDIEYWDWISQYDMKYSTPEYSSPRTITINPLWEAWRGGIPSNGPLKIFIQADAPWWDESNGISFSTEVVINVSDVGTLYGVIKDESGNPVKDARVEVSGLSFWSQTYSNESGSYTVRGLKQGENYHFRAVKRGFSSAEYDIYMDTLTKSFDISLEEGIKVSGYVILPSTYIPEQDQWGNVRYELWGWVNGWSINSPQSDWTDFRISSDGDKGYYELYLSPGEFEIQAGAEGYVSFSTRVVLSEGTTYYPLNLYLEKSVKITGIVKLSSGVANEYLWVDIGARATDDSFFGWGNGEIPVGLSSGTFTVWNVIPNKEYELKFHSQYFVEYSTTISVQDKDYIFKEPIVLSEGAKLSALLKLNWNLRTSQIYSYNHYVNFEGKDVIWVGIDCFDPQRNIHRWFGFEIPYVSTSSFSTPDERIVSSTTFEIRGLDPNGLYTIESWDLKMGFEKKDKYRKYSTTETPTIEYIPFSGGIKGQLQAGTTSVNFSNFYISVMKMWDWSFQSPDPVRASTTGYFKIDYLPTGEYILTIMEDPPSGKFASITKRARVTSGKTTDLGVILLPSPSSIKGRLTLSSNKYKDWNVIVSSYGALEVKAIAVENLRMLGPEQAYDNAIMGQITIDKDTPTIANFEINGLPEGNYIIIPPVYFDSSNDEITPWGEPQVNQDLASPFPFVPLSEGETRDIGDIDVIDGYTVKGTISRPQTGRASYDVELQVRGTFMPASPRKIVLFDYDMASGRDYSSERTRSFKFTSVYPGEYNLVVRVWDQSYKDEVVPFKIVDSDIDVGVISLSKGANIKGKIVDYETGEVIYKDIKVHCEARPYIEGSYRETADWNADWVMDPEIKISSATGRFKLKNLPAGTYRVEVYDYGEEKPYKYAPVVIDGVVVPDNATDVDIGTIKLKKGKNISGFVKDETGNPVANIKVEAEPMSGKIQTWADAYTESDGRFVLKGLDPDVEYWRIIVSPRPDFWEREEELSYYVERIVKNVKIETDDLEVIIYPPNATVYGTIKGPVANSKDDYEIVAPFEEEGIKQFGALVVLQKAGEIYDDPLDGYSVISKPPYWDDTEKRWKTDFKITGLRDGIYNLRVMAKGFNAIFVEDIEVKPGDNEITGIELSTGAILTGSFYKPDMSKVKTTEVREIVATTPDLKEIVFGKLISNDATKEIEGFKIEGLRIGQIYMVVLPKDENVFIAPDPQFIKSSTQVYSPDGYFIYKDNPPFFVTSIVKQSSNTVRIKVWITEPIRETKGEDVIKLISVDGDTNTARGFDNINISPNKTEVEATFTFKEDETWIKFQLEGTDYNGNKQEPSNYPEGKYPFEFVYYKGWDMIVQENINPLTGGTVSMGEGDNSEVYASNGSFDGDEEVKVMISKTEYSTPTASVIGGAPSLAKALYGKILPSLAQAPGVIASDLYEINAYLISGPLASIAAGRSVKITLQYDTSTITQSDIDNHLVAIYSSDDKSNWTIVGDTWPEVDTVNHTISAEANHLTYFAIFKLSSPPDFTQKSSPQITEVNPNSGRQGKTIPVTITGSNFQDGANVNISGAGVTVTSTTVKSSTEIDITVKISSNAAVGYRDVTVTNPDGGSATMADAFLVQSGNISISAVNESDTGVQLSIGQVVTLKITGSGLDIFGNDSRDWIKLIHQELDYEIKGTTLSVSSTELRVSFNLSDAELGIYDLVLYDTGLDADSIGENYASMSSAVTLRVSPYEGDLKAYVYPNPVKDSVACIKVAIPGDSTTLDDSVEVKVKIYNLAGEEVWSKTATLKKGYGPGDDDPHYSGENVIMWDLTNNGGEKVASGVYFYIIEVEGKKLKGKFAVIK
ncbi:MAG: hypothetical protein DRI36_00690 [Caldiserica bacterium]|nr:MAG: hypothetical protein DRI36_00690 [Caldisericota bacterium]